MRRFDYEIADAANDLSDGDTITIVATNLGGTTSLPGICRISVRRKLDVQPAGAWIAFGRPSAVLPTDSRGGKRPSDPSQPTSV